MKERPILFSAPMVRAILAGTETQTRRIVKDEWAHGFVHSDSFGYRKRPLQRESGNADFVTFSEPYTESVGEPVWFYSWGNARWLRCPYGAPGDRLWVREAWQAFSIDAFKYLYDPLSSLGLRAYGGKPLAPGCQLRWGTGDAMIHYAAHPTSPAELSASPGFTTWRSTTPERWRPSIHMPRWASRITLEVIGVRVERLHAITDHDAWAEGISEVDGTLDDATICAAAHVLGCSYEDARASYAALWSEINGWPSLTANPWVWVIEFKCIEVPK